MKMLNNEAYLDVKNYLESIIFELFEYSQKRNSSRIENDRFWNDIRNILLRYHTYTPAIEKHLEGTTFKLQFLTIYFGPTINSWTQVEININKEYGEISKYKTV